MSLYFPYMFWAHVESFVSPYSLAQSGMPSPEAGWLADAFRLDVRHPCQEAQPAVEARLAELFGVPVERVLVTMGASSAMQILAARFARGARTVTEIPSYEPFRALPRLFGGELRVVERSHQGGWRLDLDRVAAEARGGRPAHVFVCSPHNPTGAVLEPEDVVRLARIAEENGGVLVSNEVYMEFAPPAERIHAALLAPNAVSIGSLTKAYGLGALRVGWMILGEGLVQERESITDLIYLGYVDPPTPSLQAALIALGDLERLIAPVRRLEFESRPHLARWLEETEGVEGSLGPHGLTAFPRIEGVDDTRALARHLADEHGVDVVPGEFFGLAGHLRIGFGVPEATLQEGLVRLTRGIEAFRSGRSSANS